MESTTVRKFYAELDKVYFINQYTLVHILKGSGTIQVDFKTYSDWDDKIIYLEKGQYIKFLSEDFLVRFITFPDEILFKSKDVRILFKHLVSLGYINYSECEDCRSFLGKTVFNTNMDKLIDTSIDQWYWQNPFSANKEEYGIIFDVKEIIDKEFSGHINIGHLKDHLIHSTHYNIQGLLKDKLGISIQKMVAGKQLMESQKELAFTDKSIQEIAFEKGFKDPAYFNRVFKNKLGQTPKNFRDNFDYGNRDRFTQDLIELIQLFHKDEHKLAFYADKMNISVKALSKKVKERMNVTLGELIRAQLIDSAKTMLQQGEIVKEVAFSLGFEEPNNFSKFFAQHTGVAPSIFKK
ncbi:helix-turn-helix transcriptional regulator [Maribacter sp. 2304DJ31-5]|uniref:helix-turn-helix transcriptional regulator n=1 Tax=Maribacter sp. 2304DJ31-5 TaxID=3386273 RepID=UPI0039BC794A